MVRRAPHRRPIRSAVVGTATALLAPRALGDVRHWEAAAKLGDQRRRRDRCLAVAGHAGHDAVGEGQMLLQNLEQRRRIRRYLAPGQNLPGLIIHAKAVSSFDTPNPTYSTMVILLFCAYWRDRPGDMMDKADALTTYPQAQQHQEDINLNMKKNVAA